MQEHQELNLPLIQEQQQQQHGHPQAAAVVPAHEFTEKGKRNIWNDAKERALIEIVRTSSSVTPWRPKHGTTKEVWKAIAQRAVTEYPHVFDSVFHWETLKEQLNRVVERQKIRRLAGDFSIKNEQEIYIDEIIKHIKTEEEQKLAEERNKEERKQKRRKSADGSDGIPFGFDHAVLGEVAVTAVGLLEPADDNLRSYGRTRKIMRVDNHSGLTLPSPLFTSVEQINNFYQEREKQRADYETLRDKERAERELERDELQRVRDEGFMKMVGDHFSAMREMFSATQEMASTTQNMMRRMLQKLGVGEED